MNSLNQIRKTFAHDSSLPGQEGKNAWLIKGDFDHFKWTNDLYGALVADYLLDWTLDVIDTALQSYQKRCGYEDFLCNIIGDDVTFYIPPGLLAEGDINQLLWEIRTAIQQSFWRRYRVGVIPLPRYFFDDIPMEMLAGMRNELEKMDIVLDFASRQRGFLALVPVGEDGKSGHLPDKVSRIIRRWSGRPIAALELWLDWIINPDDPSYCTFNQGYIVPPQVSFAACPLQINAPGEGPVPAYERVALVCQSALKICKQQGVGVLICEDGDVLQDRAVQPAPFLASKPCGSLRWSSERYLREALYFRTLDQPVLFQFNPIYRFASGMPADVLQVEKYRGNQHGVGLKGINEICGQNSADCLIWRLMLNFSEILQTTLAGKEIPCGEVWTAQFVDRITVCCEQPVFNLPEIVDLIRRLGARFNSTSGEIQMTHLRVGVILGEKHLAGYRLFNQLALVSLLPGPAAADNPAPWIEVRQNSSFSLQDGLLARERNSFTSAKRLAAYHGSTLESQPIFTLCAPGNS